MSFEHFRSAQQQGHGGYTQALSEMERGRKTSHWIWYIFPQIEGLGRSSMAQRYALEDRGEAVAYLQDEELGHNLRVITQVVAIQLRDGAQLRTLMGSGIDALKLVSSMTLFEAAGEQLLSEQPSELLSSFVANCQTILSFAELQGYPRCRHTSGRV